MFDPRDAKHKTYINGSLPEGQDTFVRGHELGHIILGHNRRFNCSNLTNREHYIVEREANVFATNLLMPEDWVRVYAIPPLNTRTIYKLKTLFAVSWAAMINRLDELNIQAKTETERQFNKTV